MLEPIERALMQALDGKVTVEAHMLATLKGEPKLKGDPKLKGEPKLKGDPKLKGEPTIVFRLPGERPRISEVRFSGNREITTAKLAMTFAAVAIGAEFKEAPVRALLDQSIRPLYEARGFIRVAFPKIVAEKSTEPGVDGVAVTITLEEGPEFKLGQVRYAAGIEGGNARELDKLAALRMGEVANFDDVQKAQNRIVQKYRGIGYLHASVKQDRTVHDEERTVDLLLTVEPGTQFT